jgi:hypothetical protein
LVAEEARVKCPKCNVEFKDAQPTNDPPCYFLHPDGKGGRGVLWVMDALMTGHYAEWRFKDHVEQVCEGPLFEDVRTAINDLPGEV